MSGPVTGDDLFVSGDGFIGRGIRWFSTARGERPAIASHVGKFYSASKTVEALDAGVVFRDWPERKHDIESDDGEWCILSPDPALTLPQSTEMRYHIGNTVGTGYGFLEYPAFMLDGLIAKMFGKRDKRPYRSDPIVFRRMFDLSPDRVCSGAASMPDIRMGILPAWMRYATPDDVWDYKTCPPITHPWRWYIKDHSEGWPEVMVQAHRQRRASTGIASVPLTVAV